MRWIACQFPVGCNSLSPAAFAPTRLQLGQWALQFTPMVCLGQWPNSLLLEVQASLRLWGGPEKLQALLQKGWADLGWPNTVLAWAPTARAADWAAAWRVTAPELPQVFSKEVFRGLPLALIPEAQKHLSTFSRMGLSSLGSLLRLPRAGLAQRFGPEFLEALDKAQGRLPDPRLPLALPATFFQTVSLSLPTDNTQVLEQACHRLLTACTGWLKAQHRGLEALHIELLQGYKDRQAIELRPSEPTNDQTRLERLVFERLRQTPLVAEVHGLSLEVTDTQPVVGKSQTLFQGSQDLQGSSEGPEKLQRLTERLESRLGPESILGIALCNSHQPEAAMALAPWHPPKRSQKAIQRAKRPAAQPIFFEASPPPGPSARKASELNIEPHADSIAGLPGMAPRPTWLLPEPLALTVRRHQPQYHGPLRLRAGPERLEFGWWAEPIQRDYFVAETTDHRLVWVFRSPSHQWFLHGFFG